MGNRLATIDMGRKLGAVPGSPCNTMWLLAWAVAYLRTKWHLDPSSRLATTDMGRKFGGLPPFGEGKWGPHPTQSRLGQGLPPYKVAS